MTYFHDLTRQQDPDMSVYKTRQGNKPPIYIHISNSLHNVSENPNYEGLVWLVKLLWSCEVASGVLVPKTCQVRAEFRFATNHWETSLQSDDVSNWMVANLESSLCLLCCIMSGFVGVSLWSTMALWLQIAECHQIDGLADACSYFSALAIRLQVSRSSI